MAFNIHDFKANGLKLGGARPNQFRITIHPPFGQGAAQQLQFLARAASIPPDIIEEVPIFYFGRAIKYAGDRTFPDWEVTIYNDEDYNLRNLFEDWSNKINALVSNRMSADAFPHSYKVSGEVHHFGKSGNIIRKYEIEGLWPKLVDTMPLDWSAQNQIQEFNVTFAYDLWNPLGTQGPASYSGVLPNDPE